MKTLQKALRLLNLTSDVTVQPQLIALNTPTIVSKVAVPLGQIVIVRGTMYFQDPTANKSGELDFHAACKNIGGTLTVLGTPVVSGGKEDADFNVTFAANSTTDTLDISAVPDATNDTRITAEFTVEHRRVVI